MHEYSIVESVVSSLLEQLKNKNVRSVAEVRFRRGSAFSEDALIQTYNTLSKGTLLEGSTISIQTVNLDFKCVCGRSQVINSDDLVGHMFICPDCGAIKEVDEAHDMELLEVIGDEK